MTTTSTTPSTYALTEGTCACPACGVLVHVRTARSLTAGGSHVAQFTGGRWTAKGITGGERVGPGPVVKYPVQSTNRVPASLAAAGVTAPTTWVEMARCNTCQKREDKAAQMLAAAPGVVARCGTVALDRLTAALDALAAMGKPVPTASPLVVSGLIAHLTAPGRHVQWSGRLSPVLTAGASPDIAQAAPWGHMGNDDWAELRAGFAWVLAERVAATDEPVHVTAPGDGLLSACGMCGIGEVRVHAVKVIRAGGVAVAREHEWRVVDVSDVRGVGARVGDGYRAETLTLCRKCSAAVDGAGAVGASALSSALLTHLAASGRGEMRAAIVDGGQVPGLVGWAALVIADRNAGRAPRVPNVLPWGHVGGVTA